MTRYGRSQRRVWRGVSIVLVLLVLTICGGGYWLYSRLDENITGIDFSRVLGEDRPTKLPSTGRNFLVLGSDSRSGANSKLDPGKISGARSDTALVIHIPEVGNRVVAVSIPRDTLVYRPECTARDGSSLPPAKRVMFNSVFALAGSACVVKTVEHMSGVLLDHFVEIDFSGFKKLVDVIGGVTVTLKHGIHDTASGLDLKPGTHRLDGRQSLQFVRTRHGIGDGSDLGRIGLQQQFLTALLHEIREQDLMGNPAKFYRVLDHLTSSLTTDSELASLRRLGEFAKRMGNFDPSHFDTIILPVRYDVRNPNRVVPAQPQANQLWNALRADRAIPRELRKAPESGANMGSYRSKWPG